LAITIAARFGLPGLTGLRLEQALSQQVKVVEDQILAQLTRAAPSLRVQQREMTAADIEAALLDGRQDAALCPRMTVADTIDRIEVCREPFVAPWPMATARRA
jgi:hypothetical protein